LLWFLLEEKMILKPDIEKYIENWQNDEFYFYLVENNLTLREEITKINDTNNGNIDDIKQEIEARLDEKLKERIRNEYNFIVNYKNEYKLDYSLFFFKMRGHDLEQIYNRIFLQSNSQNIFELNNKLKMEKEFNVLKDFLVLNCLLDAEKLTNNFIDLEVKKFLTNLKEENDHKVKYFSELEKSNLDMRQRASNLEKYADFEKQIDEKLNSLNDFFFPEEICEIFRKLTSKEE
jgi:hypothetical protein